jgi:hypothetical protein
LPTFIAMLEDLVLATLNRSFADTRG